MSINAVVIVQKRTKEIRVDLFWIMILLASMHIYFLPFGDVYTVSEKEFQVEHICYVIYLRMICTTTLSKKGGCS